ncbi:hypothetical protein J6590_055184 [Homalodisca vitripennis]|nr:hypothetical protein J6590_055184 [Homalodisca vitripennis]
MFGSPPSHLNGILFRVGREASPRTRVGGVCRPGAGLLAVTAGSLPLSDCTVIIAGTNDVASGEQLTIFKHLEGLVTARLATSHVIVAALPHRYDLPICHPINQHTQLVNFYIEEICVRLPCVKVLGFNKIHRQYFTDHGMHLRPQGRQVLAGMVLECLQRVAKLLD